MKRRLLRWIGTAVLATAAMVVAVVPGWWLQRERAAARKEGLRLEFPSKPVSPRLAKALAVWAPAKNREPLYMSVLQVIQGNAAQADRQRISRWIGAEASRFAEWRALSGEPTLGLSPATLAHEPFANAEIKMIQSAGRGLLAAAALDRSPRENLLTAARLSSLLRAEPGYLASESGAQLGSYCLLVARRKHLVRDVNAALGPSPDFRRVLALGLAGTLAQIEERSHRPGIQAFIAEHNPLAPDPRLVAVAGWRRLWAELPKDPGDFEGAAKALEARMPELNALGKDGMDPRMMIMEANSTAVYEAQGLRGIGGFEALRRRVAGR